MASAFRSSAISPDRQTYASIRFGQFRSALGYFRVNELARPLQLPAYQNRAMRIYPKDVTPECFNRGSSSGLAWIPDEAFGNDEL